jgi:hypothetical protein
VFAAGAGECEFVAGIDNLELSSDGGRTQTPDSTTLEAPNDSSALNAMAGRTDAGGGQNLSANDQPTPEAGVDARPRFESMDNGQDPWVVFQSKAAHAVNDGIDHAVVITRASGVMTIAIDGNLAASDTATATSFAELPLLEEDTDPCAVDGRMSRPLWRRDASLRRNALESVPFEPLSCRRR